MSSVEHPTIKICGISTTEAALVALESGATAIGFLLAESRRQVTPEQVREILGQLPSRRPKAVAVTVNETAESIQRIVETTGVDIVQLSGDESPDLLADIASPVWKALRFKSCTTLDDASRTIEPWLAGPHPASAILVDAEVAGMYGGSGHRADWTLSSQLAERYPVILAGGLTPENVAEAIRQVRPTGVDVSSGVETDGAKDHVKIAGFANAALGAFRDPRSSIFVEE